MVAWAGYTLLVACVAVSAVLTVCARGSAPRCVALGLNGLALAIVAVTLSARLVASVWFAVSLAIILSTLTCSGAIRISPETGARTPPSDGSHPSLAALAKAIFFAALLFACVGGALLFARAPAAVAATQLLDGADAARAIATLAFTRFAPALVGLALILLATSLGARMHGET